MLPFRGFIRTTHVAKRTLYAVGLQYIVANRGTFVLLLALYEFELTGRSDNALGVVG